MGIDEFAEYLIQHWEASGRRFLSIDGDLCAGKTTLSNDLETSMRSRGIDVVRFASDMFLVDRDKRDYSHDETMLELAAWFREYDGLPILSSLLHSAGPSTLSFPAYDRATGASTRLVTLTYDPRASFLLCEGLYITRWLELAVTPPGTQVFLTVTEEESRSRMLKRNTYIPRDRLMYECDTIYFPSIRRYHEAVIERKTVFDFVVDTTNFDQLQWRKGVLQ